MVRKKKPNHRARNAALLIPVFLIAAVAFWATLPSNAPPSQSMAGADVHLKVTMGGWNPGSFTAVTGKPVTVMMMTDASERGMGDDTHSFVLAATGTNETAVAGTNTVFTVTFPHAGMYTFWCLTCCGGTYAQAAQFESNPQNSYMAGIVTVT